MQNQNQIIGTATVSAAYGDKILVKSQKKLKGQGIKFIGKTSANGKHNANFVHRVTQKAFDKISHQYEWQS